MKYLSPRKKLFTKIAGAVFSFALLSLPALAQTPNSDFRLTSSPLPINLRVEPGSSITTTIKVKNDGVNTENIKVTLMKFKADPNTGAPMLLDREAGDDYFDWVKFSEDHFSLPSNEWKTITATFNVPSTASFGYYYAVVFSRADQPAPTEGQGTVLTGGMATLVLLEAQVPDAKKEIQVTDFSVDKSMFEFLPATFTVKLRNTGNVHIVPKGSIFLSSGSQKDIATLEVNPSLGSILPNSPRNFTSLWSDGFPYYVTKMQDGQAVLDDKGNKVQELKWDFSQVSKLRWGKYTAKLLLIYDDGHRDVPIEAEVSFWVVPWRLIFGSVGILIAFFLLGRLSNKISFRKKKKDKN